MKKYLLPKEGKFYKSCLHTHTNVSDGELTPEQLKVIYPRFRELIDMMKQDSHVDVYVVDKGNDLVNFIAELIANDEPLIFE